MDEPRPFVAERLTALFTERGLRENRRITDREVAAAAGISHTVVYNLRTGKADPTRTQAGILQAIAVWFGADPNFLMPDPGTPSALDPRAARIAMRATGLTDEGMRLLEGALDHISKMESHMQAPTASNER